MTAKYLQLYTATRLYTHQQITINRSQLKTLYIKL